MSSNTKLLAVSISLMMGLSASAAADKKKKAAQAPKAPAVASEQTVRAIGELAGKFTWGMSPEEVQKLVASDIESRYTERIKAEGSPFKQDALRRDMAEEVDKFKRSYVKFEAAATGWDVSIVDREFAHSNNESMMVIWEKDQRRFLFFWDNKLWKQFIAFNNEHPAFAGKTFDDFANVIQRRYGAASMTFRKLRTSDDQTLDHLEWPPAGDFVLWAVDLTQFYGNFCLSVFQKSRVEDLEKARAVNSPKKGREGASLVDAAMKDGGNKDQNDDIIDQITGRPVGAEVDNKQKADAKGKDKKGKDKDKKGKPAEKEKDPLEDDEADPLKGTGF